jgi:hypothetical protein
MRLHTVVLALVAFVSVLTASVPAVLAGAQDTGELASCEIARAKGIPVLGTASLSIDLTTNLAVVSFQTLSLKQKQFVVLRAMVFPDIGVSPMQYICDVLNGPTVEQEVTGQGLTLAEQILATVGLRGQIMITKRGIFGCDVLPCDSRGRQPDFALVPGTSEAGLPTSSALGDVILFAVRP